MVVIGQPKQKDYMARFAYRLQSVLNIKLQLERQARVDFGQAAAEYSRQQERLNALIQERLRYIEEGRQLRMEGLNVRELRLNEQAVKTMEEFITAQTKNVRLAEVTLESAQVNLAESMQERKVQERLRERAYEEYLEEEKRAEAKEIDELISYRYGTGDVEINGS